MNVSYAIFLFNAAKGAFPVHSQLMGSALLTVTPESSQLGTEQAQAQYHPLLALSEDTHKLCTH